MDDDTAFTLATLVAEKILQITDHSYVSGQLPILEDREVDQVTQLINKARIVIE